MQANPYQSGGGWDSGDGFGDAPPADRVSLTAVFSLLCSLPCCVIPLLGLVGVALGALSLAFIGGSNGRLSGRGVAATGIVLGLVTSVIWGAIGFGALQAWTFYSKQMVPLADQTLVAMRDGDYTAARSFMSGGLSAALTDERMAWFIDTVQAEFGKIDFAASDFGRVAEGFGAVKGAQGNMTMYGIGAPFGLVCEKGTALGWVFFDENGLGQNPQRVEIDDMAALISSGGASLRETGPASSMIGSMGIKLLRGPEAPAAPEGTGAPEEGADSPADEGV